MEKKISSLELPDVDYKITKTGSLNTNFAMIGEGDYRIGPLQTNPIQVGHGVAVGRGFSNSFYTTVVTKIILDKNKVIFHTLNSIYELEEV